MPKQKYYLITIFVFVITSCNSKQTKEKADNRYSYQYNDIDYFTLETIYSPELNSNCFVKRIIKDSLLIIEHYKNDSTLLGIQELEIKNGFYIKRNKKGENFQFIESEEAYHFKNKVVKFSYVFEKKKKLYKIEAIEVLSSKLINRFYRTSFRIDSVLEFTSENNLDSLLNKKIDFLRFLRTDSILTHQNDKIEIRREFYKKKQYQTKVL